MLRTPCRKNIRYYEASLKASDLDFIHCSPQIIEKKENTMSQIISHLYISRKPMSLLGWRYCIVFALRWYSYDTGKVNKNLAKRNL